MKPLSQLVRPNILALQPYSTARDEYAGGGIDVWLDANESPYDNGVNRYPDPHQRALKALIAELKDVDAGRIFLGNGSDEAIDLAFRIFCRPGLDNAVSIAPTYGMYRVAAATNDVQDVYKRQKGFRVEQAMDLGFGNCRISLAVERTVAYEGLDYFRGKDVYKRQK